MLGSVLVALGLGAALPSCRPSDPPRITVPILPDTAAKGQTWVWTPTCQFSPSGPSGCAPAGPTVGFAQLEGDEWNLGGTAGSGSVTMSLDPAGRLSVHGDLADAPPCTGSTCIASRANTWVRGYPSVAYGPSQCAAGSSPPTSPKFRLPVPVSAIPPDLVGTTTYTSGTPQATTDIAYDMWLNNTGTTTPCKADGTIEVMVWTDYDAKALLPDSMAAGFATVPFAVNGAVNDGTQAWSIYASNVYPGGSTAPWGGTVWLVLNRAVSGGTVSVDLSAALTAVAALLQQNFGWRDFTNLYWLDSIPFGLEFGPASADAYGAGPVHFSMTLSSYCLAVRATVAKGAC